MKQVQSLDQITSRGGPALGDVVIGAAAAVLGPVTVGATIPVLTWLALPTRPNVVRDYRGIADAPEEPQPVDEVPTGQPATESTTGTASGPRAGSWSRSLSVPSRR